MFLSNLPQDETYTVARWVISQIDEHSKTSRFSLIQSIRDFYSLDYRQLVNLMAPPETSRLKWIFIDNDAVSYAIN